MFFGKKSRRIKELEESLEKLKSEMNGLYEELHKSYAEIRLCKNINLDLSDKNRRLKSEVTRLSNAKKQLIKDKDKCKKVIKENKIKYNRDSKGRFTKKK